VATERERESTLTVSHICHRTRIPFGHVLIERRCGCKHCKRGCNKEKKDQPTTNNKKGTVSNTKQINKTCENCDPMKLELSYIQNTQQRKAWPQRGRESTLTAIHTCHRPRIPFGHVLIERRCVYKHCKRGCRKEKKNQPTTNNKKGTVSKTQKQNNITCENCDPMKLELSYIQNTQQRKAWPQRGRVHLLRYILVTAPVFQLDTS
jgi:hypothetical protein